MARADVSAEFELVRRGQARLRLRLGIVQTLALDTLLRLGEAATGIRELLLGGVAAALAAESGVELEARTDHLALGGVDVVLALGHVLAARGRRLGVALTLAQARLGFRRGETRTRLLVVEADQQLAFLDLVVELYRHVGDLAENGGADVDFAVAGLDTAGSRRHPRRAGLGLGFGGLRLTGEVRPFAQHVTAERRGNESGNDCNCPKHDV